MAVPGNELVVNHGHAIHASHEDAYLAVREAFHAARRELEDYAQEIRGDVKHREERPRGRIARLARFAKEHRYYKAGARGRHCPLQGGFHALKNPTRTRQ